VQLGRAQTGEHLLRHVKFGGLRQVSDIAGMDDERGLLGHPVHEIDGLREGPVDIGIRVLIEASVCVADLNEQRLSQPRSTLFVSGRHRQLDRREDAARQGEEGAGPAIGHAFERVATRSQQLIIRHGGLLRWFRRENLRSDGFIPGCSSTF